MRLSGVLFIFFVFAVFFVGFIVVSNAKIGVQNQVKEIELSTRKSKDRYNEIKTNHDRQLTAELNVDYNNLGYRDVLSSEVYDLDQE